MQHDMANIIAFPVRGSVAPPMIEADCAPAPQVADPAQRLKAALAGLEAALAQQAAAVATWRQSLASLRDGVAGMSGSMQILQGTLGGLQRQVDMTNGTARRLEAWADDKILQTCELAASTERQTGG